MDWQGKMKEYGSGIVTFLSSDGASIIFVVVADPVLLVGKYKGTDQERIGCPVVTDEGFFLFVTGKRTARKISQFGPHLGSRALMVVRHGAEGDKDSTYEVTLLDDAEKTKQLFEIAKREFTPELLTQSVAEAEEIMKG